MATSGTTAFNLDITDIIGHAYRQAGLEAITGGDYHDARRALELLLLEWSNEGVNFWTVKNGTVSVVAGTVTYTLATDCLDVIQAVLRSNTGLQSQNDRNLTRMAIGDYNLMSNKLLQATPGQYMVNRQITPTITLYPAPNEATTLVYWYIRKMEDIANNGTYNADTPTRFLPALVAGLAYNVAKFDKNYPLDRLSMLKGDYGEMFDKAKQEDRDRGSLRIRPTRAYR